MLKVWCGHEHLAPMTYPGQYSRCPSLSSLTEERARELCRAAPGAPRRRRRRATRHHATSKAESATFATTRVVLYPTIRQWNGCPSDKRQLVWSVVHAVKGRTGRSAPRRRARGRGQGPGSGSETHSEASPDHSLYFH